MVHPDSLCIISQGHTSTPTPEKGSWNNLRVYRLQGRVEKWHKCTLIFSSFRQEALRKDGIKKLDKY